MTAVRPSARHPWAIALGVVLLIPELVLTVLVVHQQIVVGLAGFAMTLGFVRLALAGYAVLRDRLPPVGRGPLGVAGVVATVVGALLYAQVTRTVAASGDAAYGGAVAPPAAIAVNLLVVLVLGLWISGVALALAALVGAVRASRRP